MLPTSDRFSPTLTQRRLIVSWLYGIHDTYRIQNSVFWREIFFRWHWCPGQKKSVAGSIVKVCYWKLCHWRVQLYDVFFDVGWKDKNRKFTLSSEFFSWSISTSTWNSLQPHKKKIKKKNIFDSLWNFLSEYVHTFPKVAYIITEKSNIKQKIVYFSDLSKVNFSCHTNI